MNKVFVANGLNALACLKKIIARKCRLKQIGIQYGDVLLIRFQFGLVGIRRKNGFLIYLVEFILLATDGRYEKRKKDKKKKDKKEKKESEEVQERKGLNEVFE